MDPRSISVRTDAANFSNEEKMKLSAHAAGRALVGNLPERLDSGRGSELGAEAQHIAKSHGLYLQYNRALTGQEKDWRFMVRVTIPGGGMITPAQYRILDQISERFTPNTEGRPSLRLTTRQNVQFHWVRIGEVRELVRALASSGFYSLNGCGDNVRNVMGCPLSSGSALYDANAQARHFGEYFRLPADPHIQVFGIDPDFIRTPEHRFEYAPNLLNRKFKIAFSTLHQDPQSGAVIYDNCVEVRTNDLGVSPLFENGKVERFVIYVGGGQGEKNGKASLAMLAEPLGVVDRASLERALDAVVRVHQEVGDRQSRHLARLKFVIKTQGIDWFKREVEAHGVQFSNVPSGYSPGVRMLHHGWSRQHDKRWTFGAFIESGRLIDGGPNGNLKSMVREIVDRFGFNLAITPSQDLLVRDVDESQRAEFERAIGSFGFGTRDGRGFSKLRRHSIACVGLPTCSLAYTDSERYLPSVIDELETLGYGELCESIGMSGCERQCPRPGTKVIGWVGAGRDLYKLKLGGTVDADSQGELLVEENSQAYLTRVHKKDLVAVTAALFDYFKSNAHQEESMGSFFQRVGIREVIGALKSDARTADLLSNSVELKLQAPTNWLLGKGKSCL